MSATRDPSQKHTFVYSNLYQLYRKGKEAAVKADVPAAKSPESDLGLEKSRIIKVEEMANQAAVGIRIARHEPPRLLTKHIQANRPVPTPKAELARRKSIDGLRDNLRQLQSLHERLRFMLKEIEELSKE
jgi:hypothetical protein